MREKKQPTAENLQQWAELCRIITVTYTAEVSSSNEYFGEYVNSHRINYWEWFVIPDEIILTPASQIIFKPRKFNPKNFKIKPLFFCNRTMIPLRI